MDLVDFSLEKLEEYNKNMTVKNFSNLPPKIYLLNQISVRLSVYSRFQ